MKSWRVTWEIDIEADTPREAAEQAQAIQRDVMSIATVFRVVPGDDVETVVDLDEPEE